MPARSSYSVFGAAVSVVYFFLDIADATMGASSTPAAPNRNPPGSEPNPSDVLGLQASMCFDWA